jgi:hypothetical protein
MGAEKYGSPSVLKGNYPVLNIYKAKSINILRETQGGSFVRL